MQKMTKNLSKELKQYYHEIGKALTCNNREKKNIINSIKTSVECYLSENPDLTIDDIIKKFGSVKDIAEEYYNNESAENITAKMKKSKKILLCVIVTLSLALLIYIVIAITAFIQGTSKSDGYYVDSLITEEVSQTDL